MTARCDDVIMAQAGFAFIFFGYFFFITFFVSLLATFNCLLLLALFSYDFFGIYLIILRLIRVRVRNSLDKLAQMF